MIGTGDTEMKKILAAITLSLFAVAALADPCMDANVSASGLYENQADEDFFYSNEDC